jgi:hypothetical protein
VVLVEAVADHLVLLQAVQARPDKVLQVVMHPVASSAQEVEGPGRLVLLLEQVLAHIVL